MLVVLLLVQPETAAKASANHSWMVMPVRDGLATAKKAVKIVISRIRLVFLDNGNSLKNAKFVVQ